MKSIDVAYNCEKLNLIKFDFDRKKMFSTVVFDISWTVWIRVSTEIVILAFSKNDEKKYISKGQCHEIFECWFYFHQTTSPGSQ